MFINFLENNLILILISSIVIAILGVLFFCDNYKKISCLAASFTSIILLFFMIALDSAKKMEILSILISLLLLFAATLIIGINIANKVSLKKEKEEIE